MKRFAAVLVIVLSSCSPRLITETRTEYVRRDSTVVRDTTIFVRLPAEVKEVMVHPADTSFLETALAESLAYTDSLGLHHTLRNKDRDWGVTVPKITRTVTTANESERIRTVVREVERKPKWHERVRIRAFLPLLLLCMLGWRREIMKAVMTLF